MPSSSTLILIFFVVTLLLCFGGRQLHVSERPRRMLPLLFALALGGLLAYQALWQIWGGNSIPFQKFMRRYDRRPTSIAATDQPRGKILDRYGRLLSETPLKKRWERRAPLGAAAMPLLGYSHTTYGLSGLERVFDSLLGGFDEALDTANPPPVGFFERFRRMPQRRGKDVVLTLDRDYQRLAYKLLAGRKGAVVMMDPNNGALLAMVSSPSVNYAGIEQAMHDKANSPLFNRALHGLYPPGSTFKIFTAAVALEQDQAHPLACDASGWEPGPYTRPIRDTHPLSGLVTLDKAIIQSSNIYFARTARAVGYPAMRDAFDVLFPDKQLTIAYQRVREAQSVAAVFPDYSKRPNQIAYVGFGQGDLLLTPLHLTVLTASIANGGYAVTPSVIEQQIQPPRPIWQAKTARRVSKALYQTTRHGTAKACQIRNLPVCAKTGTAENASNRDHAWFTCYAPADDPQIVITVLVEEGGYGAATALPIARKLLEKSLSR